MKNSIAELPASLAFRIETNDTGSFVNWDRTSIYTPDTCASRNENRAGSSHWADAAEDVEKDDAFSTASVDTATRPHGDSFTRTVSAQRF